MIDISEYKDPATKYANAVLTNRIKAGQWVRDACRRHIRDLYNQDKQEYLYIPQLGRRFEIFANDLTVYKLGRPVRFELAPFQQFIAYSVFSWVVGRDNPSPLIPGTRKYREVIFYTAKGNGKTPFACAIDLFMLALDGYYDLNSYTIDEIFEENDSWVSTPFPECYVTATNKDQAIDLAMFGIKKLLAFSDDDIESFGFDMGKSKRPEVLNCEASGGKLTCLTTVREGSGKSGYIVSHIHAEEPHEWSKDSGQLEILKKGAKNTPQQLCLIVSNAPKTMSGIAWDYRVAAIRACKTGVPENLFGFIAECDLSDFPSRESDQEFPATKHWYKANPGLQHDIIRMDYIDKEIKSSKNPEEIVDTNRLCFGKVPGDAGGLFERADWDKVNIDKLPRKEFINLYHPDTTKLYISIDLAERINFASIGELYVPDDEDIKPLLKVRYFTPEVDLEKRAKRAQGAYILRWIKEKYITVLPGAVIGYKLMGIYLSELYETFDRSFFCADPAHMMQFANQCIGDGIMVDFIVSKQDQKNHEESGEDRMKILVHAQGFHPSRVTGLGMTDSIADFRNCVLSQKVSIEKNPVTDWCLECVQLKEDENKNVKLDKRTATKHGKGTDDGVTVSVMVCGLWQTDLRKEGISDEHWLVGRYEKDPDYNPFKVF